MAKEFKLEDPGEGIHEAEILEVHISQGDEVSEDDVILTVETDKATLEVPSPFTGTIEEIKVKAGDVAKVGETLITYSEDGGESTKKAKKQDKRKETASKENEEKKRRKERAAKDRKKGEEEDEEPGKEEASEDKRKQKKKKESAAERASGNGASRNGKPSGDRPVPAAPATRRLARELGVDLHDVEPSGPGGRVTAEDVQSAAGEKPKREAKEEKPAEERAEKEPRREGKPLPAAGEAPPLPDFEQWGEVSRVPLRGVRRATARQMALAWSQIPHVMHQDVADITELERFRQKSKRQVESKDGSLSMTVFVLKAAVAALREFPTFNASLDSENGEVVLKRYFHVGVAVDTKDGLLVPVVRDVDRKNVQELSEELSELVHKTRQGKLEPDQMKGGSFTITNPGPLGGTSFTPIINYPEVAILGLAQAGLQPVVEGDLQRYEVKARLQLPLCLAFDHRVNDGADAARFVNRIKELLADPQSFLLSV